MDLHSDPLFWPRYKPDPTFFEPLNADAACDVAVIGAGVTGALAAYHLARESISVVVLDRRPVCRGSTAASTGLLQYEIDTPLVDLMKLIGPDRARQAYRVSRRSLDAFSPIAADLDTPVDLIPRPSLYLAADEADVPALHRESEERRAIGLEVAFLSQAELLRDFAIDRPAALWSTHAMEIDPYHFSLALLRRAARNGASVFADTAVARYDSDEQGVTLRTASGLSVRCRKVVFATGYETPEFLDQSICTLKSTYALVGEPGSDFSRWPMRCLIWEASRPYFYARTTADGRIMVGGEDDNVLDAEVRDRQIDAKAQALVEKFHTLMPRLPLQPAFKWAGTFAQTKDGLPYIGCTPQFPHGYFALGYGGNGITFSLIAAKIITGLFLGRPNEDAELFRFDR